MVTYSTRSRIQCALRIAATPIADIEGKRSALENRLRESEQMYRLRLDGRQD
jgi:hypothetical protein